MPLINAAGKRVFFAHVPALRPLALLLSRERDMAGVSRTTDSE